jgi:uncharacterized protein YqcC (DUF446 family)
MFWVCVASDWASKARDYLLLMDEIETELRRRGQWEATPPEPAAFDSRLPFCCDTLRFTQWLQWVFIPHTRALAEAARPMPSASGIHVMGEESLRGCDWETGPLLILLDRFDRMINPSS